MIMVSKTYVPKTSIFELPRVKNCKSSVNPSLGSPPPAAAPDLIPK